MNIFFFFLIFAHFILLFIQSNTLIQGRCFCLPIVFIWFYLPLSRPRTLAYLIYIHAKHNAIFKTIFTKICIIQKNVVPLPSQRLRHTLWTIKSRYIFYLSAWKHIRCVTACPVMIPLPSSIEKGWRHILPSTMTCFIRKGKNGLLMILTNLFKIANETLSR